mmetsp:Transcript_18354/g.65304  ORF Transcript_18354/g.65304 Transcript_18354/m.65304 type:complete len:316 (+) Transcript_18354:99-1046(+)
MARLVNAVAAARTMALALQTALDDVATAAAADRATLEALRLTHRSDHEKAMAAVEAERRRDDEDLGALRDALSKKRRCMDDELKRRNAALAGPDTFTLNVGGVRFEASRAVLTRVDDSMLGRMFGRCDAMLQTDADGCVFIDRDGGRFRFVLDFLRDGAACKAAANAGLAQTLQSLCEVERQALLREFAYFGLEDAISGVLAPGDDSFWTNWHVEDNSAFQNGPALSTARSACAAVRVDDTVVVIGGLSGGGPEEEGDDALGTTELLDVTTMRFRPGPQLLEARAGCAACALDGRSVLVAGGERPRHHAHGVASV